MNIGIISINMYTKGLNYACPVHTFAFQQFLLSHGIDCTVVDYKPNYYGNFESRYPAGLYKRLVERQEKAVAEGKILTEDEAARLAKHRKKAAGYSALEKERALRYDRFWDFIDAYYIKTDKTYDSDLLEVEDPGFDCYICATDVIWKYQDVEGFDRGYFLASSAMENKWKIAYSASRGVPKEMDDDQYRQFFYFIEDIDEISVRERSLKELIESESDKKAQLVMDPVLLNDASLYENVAVKPEEEHYVLVYYAEERSSNTMQKAIEYAKERGLKIVETTNLPLPGGELGDNDEIESVFRYDIGPAEWLGYIQHADCVFTNSFHGTCFSILFERDFFVGSRHGDKIANLLETLELQDRQLLPNATDPLPTMHAIDYPRVKELLAEATKSSSEFILNAIHSLESKTRAPRDYTWWKKGQSYPVVYESGTKLLGAVEPMFGFEGSSTRRTDGSLALRAAKRSVNSRFTDMPLFCTEGTPTGWHLQFKIDNTFFWYLENGEFAPVESWDETVHAPKVLFENRARIPYIPVNHIALVKAIAAGWHPTENESLELIVNSGCKSAWANVKTSSFDITTLSSGSLEYRLPDAWKNDGTFCIGEAPFKRDEFLITGWRVRVRIRDEWFWLLENSKLCPTKSWSQEQGKRKSVAPGAPIPAIPSRDLEVIAIEAQWKAVPTIRSKAKRALKRLTKTS